MDNITDIVTQSKWDRVAGSFDFMAGLGAEKRWGDVKRELFLHMNGRVLFLALGTGLDIPHFPKGKTIEAIDISPKMLAKAEFKIAAYEGTINAQVMDVHQLMYEDNYFDQIYTSCTFCSVPKPIDGLKSLKRVLKPNGTLRMFEHTGSRYFPFNVMMHVMTLVTRSTGPEMNRDTVSNVRAAGFSKVKTESVYLDIVRTVTATKS